MFVGTPLGELREVIDDALGVGVEDVRAVAVDQHAGLVVVVVGIAGDMRAPVDHQHALVQPRGKALGKHAAGKAGADDEVVEAASARLWLVARACAETFRVAVLRAHIAHCIFSFIRLQV